MRVGGMPERPKGAVCKIAGVAYGGSNPPPPTSQGVPAEVQQPGVQRDLRLDLLRLLNESNAAGFSSGLVDFFFDALPALVLLARR
jgi:hypothetical protein